MLSHARPIMALYRDTSLTTKNCTFRVTRLAWTGSTMSPKEVDVAQLNPDSKCPEFSRADGE